TPKHDAMSHFASDGTLGGAISRSAKLNGLELRCRKQRGALNCIADHRCSLIIQRAPIALERTVYWLGVLSM
ncbi:MAG: hypothetical protein AAFO79_11240, partial [Pseudomonadota bacterium]